MNNQKFTYISDGKLTSKYFLIKDSIQFEFADNNLYAKSVIRWSTCRDYVLILKEKYYKDGLKLGDTLYVNLQSLNNDTIKCLASAYGKTFEIKMLKGK